MKKSFLLSLIVSLIIGIAMSTQAEAQSRRGVTTTISYSSYQVNDGEDTLDGSSLDLSLLVPISQQWGIYTSISSGHAEGTHENEDGTENELTADTNSLGIGGNWSLDTKSRFQPYFRIGVIVQSYSYKFDYAESETGETSGTGLGYGGGLGVRMKLSRNFLLIPGYAYSLVSYESEDGDKRSMESSGPTLAIVAAF